MDDTRTLRWVLRVGVAGTFAGHGTYALLTRPDWLAWFGVIGLDPVQAEPLLRTIGAIDWVVAVSVLVRPMGPVLLYAAAWAAIAALARPINGLNWLEFIERASNFCAPLALYLALRAEERRRARDQGETL